MSDKSPRQQMSKKSAKSIKEKRADRRAQEPGGPISVVPQRKGKPSR